MDYTVTKIAENLYQFNEASDVGGLQEVKPYVDAYLYIGKERAALIDCLQNAKKLYEGVRKLTSLPVDVLITHGHWDHVGVSAMEFIEAGCRLYMNKKDYESLIQMGGCKVPEERIADIQGGEKFLLGGCILEAISCGGHTPGCMVFLDREHQVAFTGDTVGSGSFWMQFPSCLPISLFQKNVKRLWQEVKELPELLIYPGHRHQSPVQLTGQYIKDTYTIATRLINGTIVGEDKVIDIPDQHMECKTVAHGQMLDFCYDPLQLIGPRPAREEEMIKVVEGRTCF